ncbi:RcpC/CpaB family pilus assembly protein [Clostridium sp. C8]|uniref:Flp pilus assembly protein CpaB n=1 Tax=Clostridium sp. C8 TaxID=1667357 RepID=UPI00062E6EBA|nr:RcpC/CpaB family pilus assembly protein [Clostridium sp. C8]KLE14408.1 pilus assembly protein CpaB [Clostridium sp. C8]
MKNLLKNRTIVGLSSIILSLIICFAVTPLYNNALQSKVKIIRIAKDVSKGDIISSDKLETVEIGGYNLPKDVLRDKESVVGKYATADLSKGDYILNSKVSSSPLAENKYLYSLDGNSEAISITIKSFAAGLSGKLQAGDIISIIASDYGDLRETIVPNELQYVKVLAVTTSKGSDNVYSQNNKNNKDNSNDTENQLPSTVTLLVNKVQAKLLAKLENQSKIHVSLVYRGTEENAQKFLDAQNNIFNEKTDNKTSGNTLDKSLGQGANVNEK